MCNKMLLCFPWKSFNTYFLNFIHTNGETISVDYEYNFKTEIFFNKLYKIKTLTVTIQKL